MSARDLSEAATVQGRLPQQPATLFPARLRGYRCWLRAGKQLFALLSRANISFLASAVAFYGMLSVFPGLAMVISAYGLVANPVTVENQLSTLSQLLPREAMDLISAQLHGIITKNNSELSWGFILGLMLGLWSARAASLSLMTALNVIYDQEEKRGLLMQQAIALVLTLCGGGFGIVALTMVAIVPAVVGLLPNIAFLPGWAELKGLISDLRWPILAGIIAFGFASIYRFAPSRDRVAWLLIAPGAIVGMVLWLAGSMLFSFYVSSFGSYDKIYGSLGAVIILLMWFYVSGIAVLFGAAVNAELERWWFEKDEHPESV